MFHAFRTITLLLLAVPAAAQSTVTINVNCNSQTMTDQYWQFTMDVSDGTNTERVVLTLPPGADAAAITAGLGKKLNDAFKLYAAPRFTWGETSGENTKAPKRTAEDLHFPPGYTLKNWCSGKFKGTDKDKKSDPDNYDIKDDHVKAFDGKGDQIQPKKPE
ncbi:MAG: hypothetical protein KDC87_02800 [Planctomycetes bacterium]|nr:hypothetical protein [Planctomycetota bacterium]MCB9869139.1 hypothetical protein [Planctomycetota bacterium]MCB9889025.1 hypothetical protein [Planctomycetota bacterium]